MNILGLPLPCVWYDTEQLNLALVTNNIEKMLHGPSFLDVQFSVDDCNTHYRFWQDSGLLHHKS